MKMPSVLSRLTRSTARHSEYAWGGGLQPDCLAERRYKELGIFMNWLWYTALLSVVFLPAAWTTQTIGGSNTYQAGLDLSLGVVTFGGSGALLHFVRYSFIRVYLRVVSGSWAPPYGTPVRNPRAARLMTSSSVDLVFQGACSLVIMAVLFWLNP